MKEIKSLPVKRQVSVSGILKKLGVSRSGYNAWKKRVPSDTSVRRAVLKEKIQKIYEESHPAHPDAVWCSDITYIWTFEGFVYLTSVMDLLWSSIFVTLMANKIGGLQFGIYRNCQISSRVFHTAVAALPLTKANRSDFE